MSETARKLILLMKATKALILFPSKLDPSIKHEPFSFSNGYPHIKYEVPPNPLYHYTSLANAKLILEGRNLKFSSPDTFNDPFDMYEGLMDFTCSVRSVKNWLRVNEYLKSKEEKRALLKMIKENGTEGFVELGKEGFQKSKKDIGVLCLSEKFDITLLWSHYADKHSGICLGFDFNIVGRQDDFFVALRKVRYQAKITPVSFFDKRNDALDYWLHCKSLDWAYEHEVRAVINKRFGFDLFPFSRDCLKAIYFGCRVSSNDRKMILDLVDRYQYKPTTIKQMIIDNSDFAVKPVAI